MHPARAGEREGASMFEPQPGSVAAPSQAPAGATGTDLQYEAAQGALTDLLRQSYTELPLRNAEKLDSVLTALLQACGITATLFTAGLAPTAIRSTDPIYKVAYVVGLALFVLALVVLGLGIQVRTPTGALRGMDWDALNEWRRHLEEHVRRKKRAQDVGVVLFLLAVVMIFAATTYAVLIAR
jgi:hypothetical protein